MNDSRRLIRGISANLVAVGTRIAVQFATLPIFFASWTVEAVGSWLILFAVPAYLALVGNGFAGAGGTSTSRPSWSSISSVAISSPSLA